MNPLWSRLWAKGQTRADPGETTERVSDPLNRRCSSWQELFAALLTYSPNATNIFRGHANAEWELVTSLERRLKSLPDSRDRMVAERGIHRRFTERSQSLLHDCPNEDDELSWLMLMQHYGAPTRLLDWSTSPFVALFFAFEQPVAVAERALWVLSASWLRFQFGTKLFLHMRDPWGLIAETETSATGDVTTSFPGVGFDWRSAENRRLLDLRAQKCAMPYPLLPPTLTERMSAQQAVFTYDAALEGGVPYRTLPTMHRYVLPNSWRVPVLGALRTMGLSASSLFPGLDGIGRAAALSVDLPDELEDQLGF